MPAIGSLESAPSGHIPGVQIAIEGGRILAEFIYQLQDLRKVVAARSRHARRHHARLPARAPRSACSAQRRRQEHAAADHGRRRQGVPRRGAARPTGCAIGFLPQEPQLDPSKDVLGNVEEGVAEIARRCCAASRRSRRSFAEPIDDDEMDALLEEQAQAAGRRSTRRTPGSSTARSRSRWTRCACRRATPTSTRSRAASGAAWRSAGCCCRSPTCCCSTSRPTTSTPSRSRGSSASCRSTRARSSPSRTIATSSTTSPAGSSSSTAARGIPCKGNYSVVARAEAEAPRARGEAGLGARQRTLERELEWVRMSPRARQAKSKARVARLRGAARRGGATRAPETVEIAIPPGPRLGDVVIEAEHLAQGLRRPAADRRPRRSRCRPAASSA